MVGDGVVVGGSISQVGNICLGVGTSGFMWGMR